MTRARTTGKRLSTTAIACGLVGRDRLFLDILGGMLRLRRGVRIVATVLADGRATDGPSPDPATPKIDLVVVDVDRRRGLWAAPAQRLLAGSREPRLILVAGGADAIRRPRWLADLRHAVVAREDGFAALLAALEQLCGDRLRPLASADAPPRRHAPLTDREAEVVALLGDGLTTKEIARRLGRSPLTIQTHRKRIVAKLGRLGSRTAARAVVLRRSLFEVG